MSEGSIPRLEVEVRPEDFRKKHMIVSLNLRHVLISTIAEKRVWIWRAHDAEEEATDMVVQKRCAAGQKFECRDGG